MLEEAEHAAGEALAAAHDDRVGAEIALDLRDELLDGAPAVDARRGLAAAAEAGAGLASERFQQLSGRAHGHSFGGSRREHEHTPSNAHAWITPIVSTLMPGAISL